MNKKYIILAGIVLLVLILAYYLVSNSAPSAGQPQGSAAVEGDITVPTAGTQIESIQSSTDENVDMGSLI